MPTKTETEPANNGATPGVGSMRALHGVEPTDLTELPTSSRQREATKSQVYDDLIEESLENGAIFRISEPDKKEAARIFVRIKNRTAKLHNRALDYGKGTDGSIVWRVSADPPKTRTKRASE